MCAVCYDEKGRRAEQGRNMSRAQEEAIRKQINPLFSLQDPSLPIGLCLYCRIRLAQQMREETETACLPSTTRYKAPQPLSACSTYSNPCLRETRSTEGCCCRICTYAHTSGLDAKGLLQRPRKTESNIKVCSKCRAEIYPGCSHSEVACSSKRAQLSNIESLAGKENLEKIAVNVVKDKAAGGDVANLKGKNGKAVKINIEKSKKKVAEKITIDDVQKLRGFGLSEKQTISTLRVFRKKNSNLAVPNLEKQAAVEKRALEPYFTKERIKFLKTAPKKLKKAGKAVDTMVERPAVYCHNPAGLVERVADARGLKRKALPKIGLDSGRGEILVNNFITNQPPRAPPSHRHYL